MMLCMSLLGIGRPLVGVSLISTPMVSSVGSPTVSPVGLMVVSLLLPQIPVGEGGFGPTPGLVHPKGAPKCPHGFGCLRILFDLFEHPINLWLQKVFPVKLEVDEMLVHLGQSMMLVLTTLEAVSAASRTQQMMA